MLMLPRRRFLAGLASALAAPAIVRAESLMPVSAKLLKPRAICFEVLASDGTPIKPGELVSGDVYLMSYNGTDLMSYNGTDWLLADSRFPEYQCPHR